ncbi:hypothetical protein HHI36_004462 [Cryptolaemus montrouzieri]|uniref:Uncharacterized protein n=1 Tax=Cryptolaemus montrouzieri TaxID=559131 RepID=A0ABD2NRK3_9CUCU
MANLDSCTVCSDNCVVNTKSLSCFHYQAKYQRQCVEVEDAILKPIQELANLFWICDSCLPVVSNGINQAMMGVIGAGTTKSTGRKQLSALRKTSTNSKPIAGESRFTLLTAVPKTIEIHVSRLAPSTEVEDIVDSLKDVIPDVSCTQLNFKYPNTYASFKLTVPVDLVKKFWILTFGQRV